MATIIQSKEITQNDISHKKAKFEFLDSGIVHNLNSDESLEVMENLAKREFLDNGCKITEITIKAPLLFLDIGDIVEINSIFFNIPQEAKKSKFIIKAINYEIDALRAYTNITAIRWD